MFYEEASAIRFTRKEILTREWPEWLNEAVSRGTVRFVQWENPCNPLGELVCEIDISSGGKRMVKEGDYIIRGFDGSIYSCDEAIFKGCFKVFEDLDDLDLTCREAFHLWGPEKQIGKLAEECTECADAAFKALKYHGLDSLSHLLEEICDVEIVCRQLSNLFDERDRNDMLKKKLSKLVSAISSEKSAQSMTAGNERNSR